MDGFQRRRKQKEKIILEASLALFMENGVKKVTIAEIANQANVSQVTIYKYFESKHNLIHEVFLYYLHKKSEEFDQLLHSDLPFPEKIKKLIFVKHAEAAKINKDFYQHIMREYTAGARAMTALYEEKGIPSYIELFNQGKAEGYIDPALSNEAIVFFLGALNEYLQKEEVYQRLLPLSDDIMRIFFYGVLGKGKQPR